MCRAAAPVASAGSSALIRRTPIVRSRISSSPSSALPMPRFRQRLLSATTDIQARSPCNCAAAMPTMSSPITATTAGWPHLAVEITSETPNTGCISSRPRLWSHRQIAWSRSSSWKSRSRQGGMTVGTWPSGRRASPKWVVRPGSAAARGATLLVGWLALSAGNKAAPPRVERIRLNFGGLNA